MIDILALIVLFLFTVTGFIGIFFTTFGTLIIYIGIIIYAALTGFTVLNPRTLLLLGVLYGVGEAAEYLTAVAGVKRSGATNAAVAGALIGGVAGAAAGALLLGVGVVPGALAGIFLGAFLAEFARKRDWAGSVKAGMGGVLGRLTAVIVKVIIAVIMTVMVLSRIRP
ncbi:MAG: DUF456 family protein [Candidatus Omnitrophica bacterium]|nr:DUF456 family protein [Candidatus Omnitrophota bacterium]